MKKKINILFIAIIIIFLFFWLMANYMDRVLKDAFILMAGLGIVLTLYLLDRLTIFRKKLELALKHILDNNFLTGVSISGKDEFVNLAKKFNQAIDRINEYDALRENKFVGMSRLINNINRNIESGVMIFDLGSSLVKINKSAQEIFGINQDELSIDSVIKLESNNPFKNLYQDIIDGKANTITGDLELFLPVLKAKARIKPKMFAIKDKSEKLNAVLCMFNKT